MQRDYDSPAGSADGFFSNQLADAGRRMWNGVLSGFKRVKNKLQNTFQGESPSEKQSLSEPSSALQNIASSSAWLFPAGGVATALLFRTQIEELFGNFFGKPSLAIILYIYHKNKVVANLFC